MARKEPIGFAVSPRVGVQRRTANPSTSLRGDSGAPGRNAMAAVESHRQVIELTAERSGRAYAALRAVQ